MEQAPVGRVRAAGTDIRVSRTQQVMPDFVDEVADRLLRTGKGKRLSAAGCPAGVNAVAAADFDLPGAEGGDAVPAGAEGMRAAVGPAIDDDHIIEGAVGFVEVQAGRGRAPALEGSERLREAARLRATIAEQVLQYVPVHFGVAAAVEGIGHANIGRGAGEREAPEGGLIKIEGQVFVAVLGAGFLKGGADEVVHPGGDGFGGGRIRVLLPKRHGGIVAVEAGEHEQRVDVAGSGHQLTVAEGVAGGRLKHRRLHKCWGREAGGP